MRQLLLRFWQWLGRLLGIDAGASPQDRPPGESLPPPAVAGPAAPPMLQLDLTTGEPPRYSKYKSVLTFQEQKFYLALLRALQNRYEVLAKVRLADFIRLDNHPADEKFHRNQLLCKHVDFLLCTPGLLTPLLVIELDDPSHQFPETQVRDQFKNELFDAVGLPLLRQPLQPNGYSSRYLRERIEATLSSS